MKAVRIDGLKVELTDVDYDLIQKEYESYSQKGKIVKAEAHKDLLEKLDAIKANGGEINEETIKQAAQELEEKAKADIKARRAEIKALKEKCNVWWHYDTTDEDDATIVVALAASL